MESKMTQRELETSPQAYARICGWLYLAIFVAAGFFLYVSSKLVVSGDAAATARHIIDSESLWRAGFVSYLVGGVGYVPITLILYVLLKPVDRNLSLLAAFFSLMGCAIWCIATIGQIAPLLLLGGADYLKTVDPHQLQSQAVLSIKLSGYGSDISMVFFGFYCLSIGYLIFRAGYFPKTLGVLLAIAGLCDVTDNLTYFLAPAFDARLSPWIAVPPALGELSLCLWLIVMGVNVAKWNEANQLVSA
jgi:hypothetical protein